MRHEFTTDCFSSACLTLRWILLVLTASAIDRPFAAGEVSKGHRILIERGLQVHGMVSKDDVFQLSNYQNANYSTIHWLWESNPTLHGPAPGFPWARWVPDETKMPGAAEQPYLNQLVALQLGDEWHLNDPAVRDRAVNWFNAIRNQWPNTILYMNNWGGQVNDAALGDFVTRARPDMLSFDTYPFKADYDSGQPSEPAYGSPTNWYAQLRRYRVFAQNAGVPLAVYRQTFHAVESPPTRYRDPSPSEMNLNTFGALAFGATTLIDFTYNTGASSIAPSGNFQPGYALQAEINRRARNLGKALVHLTPLDNTLSGTLNGGLPTLDIMFYRGKTGPGAADVTPLPIGFSADDNSPNTFSEWIPDRNDPYMRGWVVTNLGTQNNGLRGDAIVSWFKALEPALDDPSNAVDQLYFMVTNGFTGPNGNAADYRQRIQINFLGAVGPTIQRLDSDTGLVELVDLEIIPNSGGRRKLVIELDGGMSQLFKFHTEHRFLGSMDLLPGDFDADGVVGASDYLYWRQRFGKVGPLLTIDANDDGKVNVADYTIWRNHLGNAIPVRATSEEGQLVPEPMGAGFLLLGFFLLRTIH